MTTAIEWVGATPRDEPREATDDATAALRVARAYRLAVLMVVGDPPPGAAVRVLRARNDRPEVYEVACEYDPTDPASAAYAERCRTSAPSTWAAAGMIEPDCGPAAGRW